MPGREPNEQALHDHIVTLLYNEYYNYPSRTHPHLMAFANHPMMSKAVADAHGNQLFPDIVVLHAASERLVMVAEVETGSTVDESEVQEWRDFAGLGAAFYLYVPQGMGRVAARLAPGVAMTELVQYTRDKNRLVLERCGRAAAGPA